jgi:hypothetical protein
MTMNTFARYATAAAVATFFSLAAAQASFAGSASGGVAKDQPGSGYYGYSQSVPGMTVLAPGPDYSTPYWAPDPALMWQPAAQ